MEIVRPFHSLSCLPLTLSGNYPGTPTPRFAQAEDGKGSWRMEGDG